MKKVLYIDDEINTEKMDSKIDIIVSDINVEIIKVQSIEHAMESIRFHSKQLDLVILDIIMPPEEKYTLEQTNGGTTTGLMLLQEIRREYPKMPIMIISIKRKSSLEEIIKKYKVTDFLEKPIPAAQIAAAIKRLINSD